VIPAADEADPYTGLPPREGGERAPTAAALRLLLNHSYTN